MAKSSCKKYCAVFGCMNSTLTHPEIVFFRLPANSERRLQWLQLIHRDELENKTNFASYYVCEKHFYVQDIQQSPNRKLLKKNALPLLMLPSAASNVPGDPRKEDKQTQTDPSTVGVEKCTQTQNATNKSYAQISTGLSSNTPRKRKFKVKVLQRRKKRKLYKTENKTKKWRKSN